MSRIVELLKLVRGRIVGAGTLALFLRLYKTQVIRENEVRAYNARARSVNRVASWELVR